MSMSTSIFRTGERRASERTSECGRSGGRASARRQQVEVKSSSLHLSPLSPTPTPAHTNEARLTRDSRHYGHRITASGLDGSRVTTRPGATSVAVAYSPSLPVAHHDLYHSIHFSVRSRVHPSVRPRSRVRQTVRPRPSGHACISCWHRCYSGH